MSVTNCDYTVNYDNMVLSVFGGYEWKTQDYCYRLCAALNAVVFNAVVLSTFIEMLTNMFGAISQLVEHIPNISANLCKFITSSNLTPRLS